MLALKQRLRHLSVLGTPAPWFKDITDRELYTVENSVIWSWLEPLISDAVVPSVIVRKVVSQVPVTSCLGCSVRSAG